MEPDLVAILQATFNGTTIKEGDAFHLPGGVPGPFTLEFRCTVANQSDATAGQFIWLATLSKNGVLQPNIQPVKTETSLAPWAVVHATKYPYVDPDVEHVNEIIDYRAVLLVNPRYFGGLPESNYDNNLAVLNFSIVPLF